MNTKYRKQKTKKCVQECSKGWYCHCKVGSRTVGCCEHNGAVVWCTSYQRDQTGEILSETDYCWAVNVLDAADPNWDSKCRVNLCNTSIRIFIQSAKVHHHLFYYIHNSFLLTKDDIYNITI